MSGAPKRGKGGPCAPLATKAARKISLKGSALKQSHDLLSREKGKHGEELGPHLKDKMIRDTKKVIQTIASLEARLDSLAVGQERIQGRIGDICAAIGIRTGKSVVVAFAKREEFHDRVLPYINQHSIACEARGVGVVVVEESTVDTLRNAGFTFVVAKDMKELYSKYATQLDDYAEQTRRLYALRRSSAQSPKQV